MFQPKNKLGANAKPKEDIKPVIPEETKEEIKEPEPVVDTRTPEEVDRDYKKRVAMFMKAKDDFNKVFDDKVSEFKEFYNVEESTG